MINRINMTGGFIELVSNANLAQNLWINGNPQITLFKTIFRRHTPFATEFIPVKFKNNVNGGLLQVFKSPFWEI